MLKAWLNI